MSYKDLRDWLEEVDKIGELKKLNGVSWDVEVGAVASVTSDAVLFDNFADYPPGYRILTNMITSMPRWLLALNWATEARENELCREFKNRLQNYKPLPPKWVNEGPILENVQEGKDVNVLKFPVPKIHPGDAGRYIGSGDAVVMKDPDTGLVNFGTFRLQVHDEATLGFNLSSLGKDTGWVLKKYHDQGKSCPVVALMGIEPVIFYASTVHMVHTGQEGGEYEFAGWLKGEPIEVIKGEYTGLPIPARAEIAIEGEVVPGDWKMEGPFGEWTGYGEPREAYVIRVKRVLFRNDPILFMQSPSAPSRHPARGGLVADPRRSAIIWDQMEKAGVRGIKGVAVYATRFLQVVSIKNVYAGQSRQAGHIATQCHGGAFMGKYTIVVDDDIDPYNLDEVIWRTVRIADPQRAIDIVRYCWSDTMDCALPMGERIAKVPAPPVYNSRCVIDACKPVDWDPNVKPSIVYSPELLAKVDEKWGKVLFPVGKPKTVGWGH